MSERAQLKHLLLDVDFLHKPTIKAFRHRFGWAAIPWIIETYAQMSRASNALVTRDVLLATAEDMNLEFGEDMIAYCLAEGLIDLEGDKLSNERVRRDQESLHHKRVTTSKRVTQYRESALQTRDPVSVSDTVTGIKDLKNSLPPSVWISEFPATLDRPDVLDALKSFVKYRREKHKVFLDEQAQYALLSPYSQRPDEFVRDVNAAIASGGAWRNLRDSSNLRAQITDAKKEGRLDRDLRRIRES